MRGPPRQQRRPEHALVVLEQRQSVSQDPVPVVDAPGTIFMNL